MKKILMIVGICVVLLAIAGVFIYRAADKTNMINTALEWAQLEPLPENIENLNVEKEGSRFSRAFRITYTADEESVEHWLNKSKGAQNATKEMLDDNTVKYILEPGSGAQRAEVTVNWETMEVKIYTYWS